MPNGPVPNLSTITKVLIMSLILLVFLILILAGVFPKWNHSRNWGYYPSGGVGVIAIVLLVLILSGRF
jgi:hypothetical protein